MPDIDVDFCYERRQEVIDYVVEKYGKDQVAQIVTFGTLAAKRCDPGCGTCHGPALQPAATQVSQRWSRQNLNMTLDMALKEKSGIQRRYHDSDEQVSKLIDMSKRLEGLPRHTSMHAAGVVICQDLH